MNIFFIMNRTGSSIWRVLPQKKYFESLGHKCETTNLQAMTEEEAEKLTDWADIIVWQMTADLEIIRLQKSKGHKNIFECDDLIEWVPDTHPQKYQMNKGWSRFWHECIKEMDLITCTNQQIKDFYLKYNKNIWVLPNLLDLEYWEHPENPNIDDETIRLGWAGGISHVDDLVWFRDILKPILEKHRNVKFVCIGGGGFSNSSRLSELKFGEDIFKDIPYSQREFSVGSPPETWSRKLNTMCLDIGVVPLVRNKFSELKSNIKPMEYAICNRAAVVAQRWMYHTSVVDGETGFLAETPEEWRAALETLITNPELRRAMGQKGYEYVRRTFDIKPHLEAWRQAYNSIYPENEPRV